MFTISLFASGPLSNLQTRCGPQVEKFVHPWTQPNQSLTISDRASVMYCVNLLVAVAVVTTYCTSVTLMWVPLCIKRPAQCPAFLRVMSVSVEAVQGENLRRIRFSCTVNLGKKLDLFKIVDKIVPIKLNLSLLYEEGWLPSHEHHPYSEARGRSHHALGWFSAPGTGQLRCIKERTKSAMPSQI